MGSRRQGYCQLSSQRPAGNATIGFHQKDHISGISSLEMPLVDLKLERQLIWSFCRGRSPAFNYISDRPQGMFVWNLPWGCPEHISSNCDFKTSLNSLCHIFKNQVLSTKLQVILRNTKSLLNHHKWAENSFDRFSLEFIYSKNWTTKSNLLWSPISVLILKAKSFDFWPIFVKKNTLSLF